MLKKLVLILVSTSITLLLCELLIRLFMPQISDHDAMFEPSVDLGWQWIPNHEGTIVNSEGSSHLVTTNSAGFRDGPLPSADDETFTIMVLGDSFVSNISVETEAVFTERMESSLDSISVLNFGVNGYGQVQEYLVMDQWIDRIKPNLVVVMIYLRNDFQDNFGLESWISYPRPTASFIDNEIIMSPISQEPNISEIGRGKWYDQFHLIHFIKNRYRNIKNKMSEDGASGYLSYASPEAYLCKKPLPSSSEEMFVVLEQLLLKIEERSQASNVPVVFALAPTIVQIEDPLWNELSTNYPLEDGAYVRQYPNKLLLDFAAENQLTMLDLFKPLYQANKKEAPIYDPLQQHWTAYGNQIVAEELVQFLKQKQLIK